CVSNKSVDLLLVLDGSGSIGDDTFRNQERENGEKASDENEKVIAFAMHLAQRMNISSEGSRNGHHSICRDASTRVRPQSVHPSNAGSF
ncbi:hypothetical protein OSTOST_12609, partial [Ostertagia ostertagi]